MNARTFPIVFLRFALAIPYCWFVADRLGLLGAHGQPHVGWGDWHHFMEYASQTLSFVPSSLVLYFAIAATICEGIIGILLLIGWQIRIAATASGMLSFLFATSMAISFGIASPLGYSVYTVSAASFLLATLPHHPLSLDEGQ